MHTTCTALRFFSIASMMWISLLLCLLVQLTVVIEGQYRVLVTIHSFVLFESRCAKCYVGNSATPQSGLCCDGSNGSCPNSCDILIAFRQVERSNAGRTNHFYSEGILGYIKPNDVQQYNKTGKTGFQSFALVNPLQYGIETLDQIGEQLNVSVYNRDVGDLDDLIDQFLIIVDNSSATVHTGIYNYTQLELSIEVVENLGECVIEDEQPKCKCKPGFTGDHCECFNASDCQNGIICMNQEADGHRCECYPEFTGILFCETNIDDCIEITCNNGWTCVDSISDYHCECPFGFTGTHCEDNINDCSRVTCSGRGECVNGVESVSCACQSGYTGENCEFESGVTSTAPVTHDGSATTAVGVTSTAPVTHDGSAATAVGVTSTAPLTHDGSATTAVGVTSTAPVTHDGSATTAVGVTSTAPVTHDGSATTAVGVTSTAPVTHDGSATTAVGVTSTAPVTHDGSATTAVGVTSTAPVTHDGSATTAVGVTSTAPVTHDGSATTAVGVTSTAPVTHDGSATTAVGVTSTAPVTHDGSATTAVGVTSTAPLTHDGSAAIAAVIGGAVGGAVVLALVILFAVILVVILTRIQRRTKAYDAQGNTSAFNSNEVVLHSGDVYICKDATSKKTPTSGSEIVKEFDNPVYGDAIMELERGYVCETTDNARSEVTYSNQDQESDSERKFVNPIYGDDDNDNSHTHNENFNSAIPEHEDTDYDQVGNIYHTLESKEEREERYAQASQAALNSVDISSSGPS